MTCLNSYLRCLQYRYRFNNGSKTQNVVRGAHICPSPTKWMYLQSFWKKLTIYCKSCKISEIVFTLFLTQLPDTTFKTFRIIVNWLFWLTILLLISRSHFCITGSLTPTPLSGSAPVNFNLIASLGRSTFSYKMQKGVSTTYLCYYKIK